MDIEWWILNDEYWMMNIEWWLLILILILISSFNNININNNINNNNINNNINNNNINNNINTSIKNISSKNFRWSMPIYTLYDLSAWLDEDFKKNICVNLPKKTKTKSNHSSFLTN